jgi:hypothetical protein
MNASFADRRACAYGLVSKLSGSPLSARAAARHGSRVLGHTRPRHQPSSLGGLNPPGVEQAGGRDARNQVLRTPKPAALWPWVKRASWFELALFVALIVFWVLPGFERETFIFGLSHGIGYIGLVIFIWIAVLRREAPYTLLAATLTPVGPLGSVIGIAAIERRQARSGQRAKA